MALPLTITGGRKKKNLTV
jgi:hypothetical protein